MNKTVMTLIKLITFIIIILTVILLIPFSIINDVRDLYNTIIKKVEDRK